MNSARCNNWSLSSRRDFSLHFTVSCLTKKELEICIGRAGDIVLNLRHFPCFACSQLQLVLYYYMLCPYSHPHPILQPRRATWALLDITQTLTLTPPPQKKKVCVCKKWLQHLELSTGRKKGGKGEMEGGQIGIRHLNGELNPSGSFYLPENW